MANRHEKRAAESRRRKDAVVSAKHDKQLQLDADARRARQAASVGSIVGEMPDGRGDEPRHEIT